MVTIPVVVAVIGLILYLWSPHPKATRLGEICFAAGLLIWLFTVASRVLV